MIPEDRPDLECLETVKAEVPVKEAWQEEIQRRLQEIDSGAVQLIPWVEARRRLKAQLDR
jgi:Putative addiction module component